LRHLERKKREKGGKEEEGALHKKESFSSTVDMRVENWGGKKDVFFTLKLEKISDKEKVLNQGTFRFVGSCGGLCAD